VKAPWVRTAKEHEKAERETQSLRSHIRVLLSELERTLAEIETKAVSRRDRT
jgi:hypothetical protein